MPASAFSDTSVGTVKVPTLDEFNALAKALADLKAEMAQNDLLNRVKKLEAGHGHGHGHGNKR